MNTCDYESARRTSTYHNYCINFRHLSSCLGAFGSVWFGFSFRFSFAFPFSGVVHCVYIGIIIIRSSRASGRGRWSSVPLNWTHLHSFSSQFVPPNKENPSHFVLAACQSCESNGGTHGKVFPAHRERENIASNPRTYPHFHNSTIPHFPFPHCRESGAFAFASVHNLYA